MESFDLYNDIAKRTNGDIYIGVVGPVRTGKSTFIKKVMDLFVLPNMENPYQKERSLDEMPQSGAGKTIMTTQPHFVPNEAVKITLKEGASLKVRMVDCVGYMVKGAMGHLEEGQARMVRTPWFENEIPFEQAAELGTQKVIGEHATIGVLVTTDGSITELSRPGYLEAEERVVAELKAQKKPFVMVLNSRNPASPDTQRLADSLQEKYDVPVRALDVLNMSLSDVDDLLGMVLYEFPIQRICVDIPKWVQVLPANHWLVDNMLKAVYNASLKMQRVRDYETLLTHVQNVDLPVSADLQDITLGDGNITVAFTVNEDLYYKILSEECGMEIMGDFHLLALLTELVSMKKDYDRVAQALVSVRETGYGLVYPTLDEMKLEEPEIVKQGGRYGVKLKASAPSLHMMRVDIETEVSPVVGTEKQSEELVRYLLSGFENDPQEIWKTEIFGKSLHELVKEGLNNKLTRMPEDAQQKISETLQRIINEGNGGLICILL